MASFLSAYINLQILFITSAFWYRFTKRKFSNTSLCLRQVLRLKLDPRLRFPEMVIKGFVLQEQSVDQTAHPPGDLELQRCGLRPTTVISFGDLCGSIHPPRPARDLPLSVGQWIFLIKATKAFCLIGYIWNWLLFEPDFETRSVCLLSGFCSLKVILLCLSSKCQSVYLKFRSHFIRIPFLATSPFPITPFIICISNKQLRWRPEQVLSVLLGLETNYSSWVPS